MIGRGGQQSLLVGTAKRLAGRYLEVIVLEPLKAGEAVKVLSGDDLALGEVCGCSPAPGEYAIIIEIENTLNATALEELRRYWPRHPRSDIRG